MGTGKDSQGTLVAHFEVVRRSAVSRSRKVDLRHAVPTRDWFGSGRNRQALFLLRVFASAIICALLLISGCEQPVSQPVPHSIPSAPKTSHSTIFPLVQHADQRCLVDQTGRPFLFHGDAAWSLIAQLSREDADRYLDDRLKRGFNTLLVNLLEHHFSRKPPANYYGDAPLDTPGDFAAPNETYFLHADWLLRRAAERGFLILLAPAYLGYDGGEEGWYKEVRKAGPEKMRMYGRYLGLRYRLMKNLVWVHGGDFNPPDRVSMLALMEGIREMDPGALHSFHGARGTTARDFLGTEHSWLALNTVYTNEKTVVAVSRREYHLSPLPFVFIEGQYENAGADERVIRAQAYQAMLSGACGQVMGNKPVWMFDPDWVRSLDSPGSRSMTILRTIMEKYSWFDLRPAPEKFVSAGQGHGGQSVAAGISEDGRLALVYVPDERQIVVDGKFFGASRAEARWVDPATGNSSLASSISIGNMAEVGFDTPPKRKAGRNDWLLVLRR